MNATEHLRTLGLSEKQARAYVALVSLGEATAYQVAGAAKLKRPITYVVLDELRQKGLVLKVPHTKKQLFAAKAPGELFADYEEKFRSAKRALPELLALVQGDDRKVRVLYFEGRDGMKEALNYNIKRLAGKEVVAFYGKSDKLKRAGIPPLYAEYNQKLSDQRTRVRGVAPKHPSLDVFRVMDKKYGWDIRSLPESEFSAEVSVEVGDTFLRLMLYKESQAVVIDNIELADMMRQTFEMLWKSKEK